jgi:hypothetical protein
LYESRDAFKKKYHTAKDKEESHKYAQCVAVIHFQLRLLFLQKENATTGSFTFECTSSYWSYNGKTLNYPALSLAVSILSPVNYVRSKQNHVTPRNRCLTVQE